MNILYIQCLSGISGDMTVGALLDLGVDQKHFREEIGKLDLQGYAIKIGKGQKNGISGTKFSVILEENGGHSHRNLYDIEKIINESDLSSRVKELSLNIFRHVASAEARVHNKPLEEVHFHEVGAVDSIIDIVGAAICFAYLNVDEIYASPLHLGTGFVRCQHGLIPVPAPATLEILKGIPVYSRGIEEEMVTPTGAAIIKEVARDFVPMPGMIIEKTGYGMGEKDFPITNALRIIAGKKKEEGSFYLLETNIDDMNPELYSHLLPLLWEAGARDVYLTQIIMKKNRPGVMLSVLCRDEEREALEEIIFTETSTLGLRRYQVERPALDREKRVVNCSLGQFTLKVAQKEGRAIKLAPEYEECSRYAREHNMPLQEVYQIVMEAGRNLVLDRRTTDEE